MRNLSGQYQAVELIFKGVWSFITTTWSKFSHLNRDGVYSFQGNQANEQFTTGLTPLGYVYEYILKFDSV